MKLEQQVTSLEISKKLKELGMKQESLFYWRLGYSTEDHFENGVSTGRKGNFRDYELTYYPKPRYETADFKWNQADLQKLYETEVSAFTVAELGEMLPDDYISGQVPLDAADGKWKCLRLSFPEFEPWNKFWEYADTEADARGKMLIYLIESNLLPVKQK